jgi:hypothetical protein
VDRMALLCKIEHNASSLVVDHVEVRGYGHSGTAWRSRAWAFFWKSPAAGSAPYGAYHMIMHDRCASNLKKVLACT